MGAGKIGAKIHNNRLNEAPRLSQADEDCLTQSSLPCSNQAGQTLFFLTLYKQGNLRSEKVSNLPDSRGLAEGIGARTLASTALNRHGAVWAGGRGAAGHPDLTLSWANQGV